MRAMVHRPLVSGAGYGAEARATVSSTANSRCCTALNENHTPPQTNIPLRASSKKNVGSLLALNATPAIVDCLDVVSI